MNLGTSSRAVFHMLIDFSLLFWRFSCVFRLDVLVVSTVLAPTLLCRSLVGFHTAETGS